MPHPTPSLFDPVLLAKNEAIKQRLIKLISDGDVLLMAGAGISAISKMPTWQQLIDHMEAKALKLDPSMVRKDPNESLIAYTDRIVKVLGKRFGDIIVDLFGADDKTLGIHVTLAQLPFKAILTTNYDKILLGAVAQAYGIYPSPVVFSPKTTGRETAHFLKGLNDSAVKSPRVIHLHGYCEISDSIVLSALQYEEKYGIKIDEAPSPGKIGVYKDHGWPFLRKIMWALMATRRLVYIGFSMTDDYFRMMHQIVSEDARQGDLDVHFLVQRVTASDNIPALEARAEYLKDTFGIETLFYEDDRTYSGLPNLIVEIENSVKLIRSAPATPVVTPTVKTTPTKPAAKNIGSFVALSKHAKTIK